MKINNIIILNYSTLGRFFDFKEFWEKRHEFVKSVDPAIFFNPGSPTQQKLYEVVKLWIGKSLDPQKGSVIPDGTSAAGEVRYGSLKYPLKRTTGCGSFLSQLKPEDAIGLICLYEMMGRQLNPDTQEISSILRPDYIDWSKDIIKVPTGKKIDLPVKSRTGNTSAGLRSVLIVNTNSKMTPSTVTAGDISIELRPGECCRAIFLESECVGLLRNKERQGNQDYRLRMAEDGRSILEHNGTAIMEQGNIVAFSVNPRYPNRYVYANDKGRITSADTEIDDFEIRTSLPKTEKPLHLIIGALGELYILTSGKKLYKYDRNRGLSVTNTDEAIVMINTDNRGKVKMRTLQ